MACRTREAVSSRLELVLIGGLVPIIHGTVAGTAEAA